jgi:UDP-2-acetamido-2,6-beta-L-arabino-hexul-4-ose reductase
VTRIVVTGARGFLGRHVMSLLAYDSTVTAVPIGRETPLAERDAELARADAVIHLAGVNRPSDDREFAEVNVGLTRTIADTLTAAARGAALVYASSVRATDDTPYGRSKLAAEEIVRRYAAGPGPGRSAVTRLPNVFGKWSRPFYNTAVATFCHSIARDEPVEIRDAAHVLQLVYGEDVAAALIAQATGAARPSTDGTFDVEPRYERSLGEIVSLLRRFRALRTELVLPDFSDAFVRKLYATYLSFLPAGGEAYALQQYSDDRGSLAELLKSPWFGQVFLSRTKPGITRGNHFHHTKTEKFVVVEGDALIRLQPSEGGEVTEIPVSGAEFRVVDIPPGYSHSITNVGARELVTLFWSSEIFDRDRPDTYAREVGRAS